MLIFHDTQIRSTTFSGIFIIDHLLSLSIRTKGAILENSGILRYVSVVIPTPICFI